MEVFETARFLLASFALGGSLFAGFGNKSESNCGGMLAICSGLSVNVTNGSLAEDWNLSLVMMWMKAGREWVYYGATRRDAV
jgi:hypothetical protein